MDLDRLDSLARSLAASGSRRRLLGALAAAPLLGGLGSLFAPENADAKDRRRRRKGRHKRTKRKGQARRMRKGKRRGCTPRHRDVVCAGQCGPVTSRKTCGKTVDCGPCPDGCTPVCPANGCGMADGCGGICGCGAGTVCAEGVCETCNVTCTGSAAACGNALHDTIDAGGDVYVCPGRYEAANGFVIGSDATRIYGAGNGSDPATHTILTTSSASSPVIVNQFAALTLSGLRITGGNSDYTGGIFDSANSELMTIDNCAIVGNTGASIGGVIASGPVAITNSVISGNKGPSGIGGIYLTPTNTHVASTISNTVIDDNEGLAYGGVFLSTDSFGQTLVIDRGSRITNNRFTTLVEDQRAGGIGRIGPGVVNITDTTISGNKTPQCYNVPGCPS